MLLDPIIIMVVCFASRTSRIAAARTTATAATPRLVRFIGGSRKGLWRRQETAASFVHHGRSADTTAHHRRRIQQRNVSSKQLQQHQAALMLRLCSSRLKTTTGMIESSALINNSQEQVSLLANEIREAYRERETDGILELAAKNRQNDHLFESSSDNNRSIASHVVQASLEAANGNKGQAASILNAWIASCCKSDDDDDEREIEMKKKDRSCSLALGILEAMEELSRTASANNAPQPDMLTYALAYAALQQQDESSFHERANDIMERALRQSKKQAGSKRRKALAAARRRQSSLSTSKFYQHNRITEHGLETLQSWLNRGDDDIFDILMETDDWLAVHKPAGVVCNHKQTTTAGKKRRRRSSSKGNKQDKSKKDADMSLVDALHSINVPLSTLNPHALGLVHRLDRGTSGCLLLAKTDHFHALAVTEFYLRRAHKTYTTLLELPSSSLSSKSSAAETTATPSPLLESNQGQVDLPVDGRPARSNYKLLKRYRVPMVDAGDSEDEAATPVAALVEMETLTGRKHQVRVHASQGLHAPVILDSMYGSTETSAAAALQGIVQEAIQKHGNGGLHQDRFFLHASSLCIPALHVNVDAQVPGWWKGALESLEEVGDQSSVDP